MSETVFHPLAPLWDGNSRVLILGTMPSPASRSAAFYYAHPQNRFWPALCAALGETDPKTAQGRGEIALRRGVALWDVLASCTITGASDASIRNPVPNDFAALLQGAPIQAVFCNGTAAWKMYTKYVQPVTGLAAVRLPSTSPANAACPPQALAEIWGAALGPWIIKNK